MAARPHPYLEARGTEELARPVNAQVPVLHTSHSHSLSPGQQQRNRRIRGSPLAVTLTSAYTDPSSSGAEQSPDRDQDPSILFDYPETSQMKDKTPMAAVSRDP
ncbi:hypothetical protein KQX54_005584 [Cotesia glomerata]|uniref:Uncharacterized protein n=1 Tax=Cotesia glomerata TaxID=32391 RepID=A0AAV7I746_COTGL|nr:hypothetical protein KQX54_005584 [Cotesia glomerata]